eukprot:932771-Pelagomonas_calceolata.AAC.7
MTRIDNQSHFEKLSLAQSHAPACSLLICSIGPLGRVYLDRSCSPYTRQYNDSLAAYLREGSLANATVAQLLRPWAGLLDAYYNAAVSTEKC